MKKPTLIKNKIVTFGCRLNIYESEVIKNNLQKLKLNNNIVFNTCAVTNEAGRKARQAIRKAHRENPNARIIVTGCGAQIETKIYAKMTEVNLLLGNNEKMIAKNYLKFNFDTSKEERIKVNDIMSIKKTSKHLINGMSIHTRAFVQIQNGCNHRCTFCIIPFGRGISRSVPVGEIINQIKILVNNGYKEVVLTGVNITSYGIDLPGKLLLGNLIKRILKLIPDLPRLRISSIDSIEVDTELMDILSDKRIMPSLHLSLQHGDDIILKRMKRRHLRSDIIKFCEDVRKIRPDIIFGADIIVGFPTETNKMFETTIKLIDECKLINLHIFSFSIRENTPAAKMPQVSKSIIKQRALKLKQKSKNILENYLLTEKNKIRYVLIEKNNSGRTEHFTPVILDKKYQAGNIIKAKIIGKYNQKLLATKY